MQFGITSQSPNKARLNKIVLSKIVPHFVWDSVPVHQQVGEKWVTTSNLSMPVIDKRDNTQMYNIIGTYKLNNPIIVTKHRVDFPTMSGVRVHVVATSTDSVSQPLYSIEYFGTKKAVLTQAQGVGDKRRSLSRVGGVRVNAPKPVDIEPSVLDKLDLSRYVIAPKHDGERAIIELVDNMAYVYDTNGYQIVTGGFRMEVSVRPSVILDVEFTDTELVILDNPKSSGMSPMERLQHLKLTDKLVDALESLFPINHGTVLRVVSVKEYLPIDSCREVFGLVESNPELFDGLILTPTEWHYWYQRNSPTGVGKLTYKLKPSVKLTIDVQLRASPPLTVDRFSVLIGDELYDYDVSLRDIDLLNCVYECTLLEEDQGRVVIEPIKPRGDKQFGNSHTTINGVIRLWRNNNYEVVREMLVG